ncbi:MAG: hypothetical protein Q7U30_15105 [Methylicorpusculum sp.]|nr:hypothetical protein [Methylicorpusculum sp.]
MAETNWQHIIDVVINGKSADIEKIDDTIFIEMAGVFMALLATSMPSYKSLLLLFRIE